ncbi:MAG: hypothetical protein HeimC3_20150 [Candidatus Heimdallarchaeota archaeon LC_3]|nr:MAG: hypothetical protein HeimC3_20150 [Candidatus Heimdallarchaeota archaeon LC_3]
MSSSDKINGIPVGSKRLEEEKCGTCKKNLLLKTFLDLSSRKRILVIACDTCNYQTKLKSLDEYEKFSINPKTQKRKRGWEY